METTETTEILKSCQDSRFYNVTIKNNLRIIIRIFLPSLHQTSHRDYKHIKTNIIDNWIKIFWTVLLLVTKNMFLVSSPGHTTTTHYTLYYLRILDILKYFNFHLRKSDLYDEILKHTYMIYIMKINSVEYNKTHRQTHYLKCYRRGRKGWMWRKIFEKGDIYLNYIL